MKLMAIVTSMLLLAGCAALPPASGPVAVPADARQLAGKWSVDLRASPGDAAYAQPFIVEAVDTEKRSISGSFYNSMITWSRINTAWNKVVVTFVTSDGQGDYVHTATLEDGKLAGTSTARHRNMLVPWTAARDQK